MHDKVHEVLEREDLTAIQRAQLRGVEYALDWLLGACPNGDLRIEGDPVEEALESCYDLALVVIGGDKASGLKEIANELCIAEVYDVRPVGKS